MNKIAKVLLPLNVHLYIYTQYILVVRVARIKYRQFTVQIITIRDQKQTYKYAKEK